MLERLYEGFDYLRGHPLRLWALSKTAYLGVLDLLGGLIFLLTDWDNLMAEWVSYESSRLESKVDHKWSVCG